MNAGPSQPRPNVIWILLDAARAQNFSFNGYDRETSPNLDKLAARGAVFENHFTQGLWTEISVPQYMTGRYFPLACVDVGRIYPPRPVPEGELLFPEIMTRNGYTTAAFSAHVWITPQSPLARAFGEFHQLRPEDDTHPMVPFSELNRVAIPWLEKHRNERFFLYLHALDTHFPHFPAAPHDTWTRGKSHSLQIQNGVPISVFDSTFTDEDRDYLRGLVDDSIHSVDAEIGRLLRAIDDIGIMDSTIVVVTSDHGDALGEDGTNWGHWLPFDEVMRTPLVMAGPGISPGVRVAEITQHVDIVPTLAELLGLEDELNTDGKSLVPLVRGEHPADWRAYAFSRYFHHEYDGPPGFAIRFADFKYEYDEALNKEYLWPVPDLAATRRNVIDEHPDIAKKYRAILDNEIIPPYRAYTDLPLSCIDCPITPEVAQAAANGAPGAIIFDDGAKPESLTDSKWGYRDGSFWAAPNEDVPPITVSFDVPDGDYIVLAHCYSVKDIDGFEASAINVGWQDLGAPSLVRTFPANKYAIAYEYREAGKWTVQGGTAVLALDNVAGYWSVIDGFRFVPPFGRSTLDTNTEHERIRSLGYIE